MLATGPIDETKKAKPRASPRRKPGKSRPSPRDELPDAKLDQIYSQLVDSRKQMNQAGAVDKGKLGAALKKQIGQLKEKYKDKKMEFEIVVESGQTKIKARQKK